MAILKRLSNLLAFTVVEDHTAPSSVTTSEESRYQGNPHLPSDFTSNLHVDQHTATANVTGYLSPLETERNFKSILNSRQSLSPSSKVRGYLLSGASGRPLPVTSGKRKLDQDEDTESISGRMKKAKIADFVDQSDDGLEGETVIDTSIEDDAAGSNPNVQQVDEMEWAEDDAVDKTLVDQNENTSPFKLPLYPASKQHLFRPIAVGETAETVQVRNASDKRTLNEPATPTTDDMFVDSDTLLSVGWPTDTLLLIQKLHQRGREPILPTHWSMDFKSVPDALFTTIPIDPQYRNQETAYIRALKYGSRRDFHATKALQTLFEVPSRARDRIRTRQYLDSLANDTKEGVPTKDKVCTPHDSESLTEKGVLAYIDWAFMDAGLPLAIQPPRPEQRQSSAGASTTEPPMPALVLTHTAPKTLNSKTLEKAIQTRLINQRQNWENYIASFPPSLSAQHNDFEDPPTVYAVVISHTNVAIVAYAGRAMRQVGHFDIGDVDFDVWNALAIAILAVHARNICSAVWEHYEGEDQDSTVEESVDECVDEVDDDDDPDA